MTTFLRNLALFFQNFFLQNMINKSDCDHALKESINFCSNQMRANTYFLLKYRQQLDHVRSCATQRNIAQISVSTNCAELRIDKQQRATHTVQRGMDGGNPLLDEKIFKPHFHVKKVIFIFVARRPFPSKETWDSETVFCRFSRKYSLF